MPTILDKIVAKKRLEIAEAKQNVSIKDLEKSEWFFRDCYFLSDFILDSNQTGIIAEFKKASPSKGIINDKADVVQVSKGYAEAGASAISVLTDESFFGGNSIDLIRAREANQIPLLRKDFILDEYQLVEAKAWGADIILLIAAILSPREIQKLATLAKSLQLNVLLEVHNLEELNQSICDELDAIGINNRNLTNFSVSLDHSYKLVEHIPNQFLKISESGISDSRTIKDLKLAGFQGFLIGENFMKTRNPGLAMKEFIVELE